MQDFALSAACGGLTASGVAAPSAGVAKNPSRSSNAVSATPAKPAPVCQRNSRRVRPQNWGTIRAAIFVSIYGHVSRATRTPSTYTNSFRFNIIRHHDCIAQRGAEGPDAVWSINEVVFPFVVTFRSRTLKA